MAISTPRRITISFSAAEIQRLKDLVALSGLPEKQPIPTSKPWELGIDLTYLKNLRERFAKEWRWESLSATLNAFEHYSVRLGEDEDAFDAHFIHERSKRPDAVPLLLLHGWPGSVYDFHKVISPLTDPPEGQRAFHVVVPSLPGFFLSSHPQRQGWTIIDTARAFNSLMVDVLGYTKYVAQGGDWGSIIVRVLGRDYQQNATVVHFSALVAPRVEGTTEEPSPARKKQQEQGIDFFTNGRGFIELQRTKPFTVGYAVGASPVGILAYIGEKFHAWGDPSRLNPWSIINTSALYFLSESFASAALIYHESLLFFGELSSNRDQWLIKSDFGVAVYPYDIGGASRADAEAIGNLVHYAEYGAGGHFPALDVPDIFISDLQGAFKGFKA